MLKGGYDIVSMLEARGLSRSDAIYIKNVIKREEIPYLINSLLSENMESEEELRGLLYEYNIDLEDDVPNCEILNPEDKFFKVYGFNVKSEYSNELNDLLTIKNIPFLIKGDSIYYDCPDDITLYAINKFIEKKEKDMTKYTKLSESLVNGRVIGFSNDKERRRLAKLAGLKEDFGDFDVSDDGSIDPALDDTTSMNVDPSVDMIDQDAPIDTVNGMDTTVPSSNSEAMDIISDAFNTIQENLPNVRLSEYKPLVIRANELSDQIKTMGGSYLSERKLKI